MSDVQYVLYGSDGLGVSVDAWRNDFKEYIEEMELDIEPENEIEFYQYIFETSFDDTKDWREFREIEFANNTFMITDVEHGNMCEKAYKEFADNKIHLELEPNTIQMWYLDKQGDLRCDAADCHNGSKKHQLCRAYKAGVTEAQKEELKDRLLSGTVSQADIDNISECLGDRIAKAFEWDKVWSKETLLPPYCFSQLPSTGEIIRITRYEDGYRLANIDCGSREANAAYIKELNKSIRVTEAQEKAMSVGSMFGWNVPGANPSVYLKSAASPQREDSVKSVSAFCEKYKEQESNADRERE